MDDLGDAFEYALQNWQLPHDEMQNQKVETSVNLSIKELAEAVAQATGVTGAFHRDHGTHSGTTKKLDVGQHLQAHNWSARISMEEGLRSTVGLDRDQAGKSLAWM